MDSLVEQLQADALNPAVPVSTLLRKVKLAAVKLKLPNVEKWVEHELNGYPDKVPDYRDTIGHPKAFNPYNGWIDIHAPEDLMETLSQVIIAQPISGLEELLANADSNSFFLPYRAGQIDALNRAFGVSYARMAREVSRSQLASVLDRVRTLVLDWALELERQGIMGSGISFDDREKRIAQDRNVNIHVGSIGTFTGSLSTDIDGDNARINAGSRDQSSNERRGR